MTGRRRVKQQEIGQMLNVSALCGARKLAFIQNFLRNVHSNSTLKH